MGLYIGLMSGTSMDGVDAALVDLDGYAIALLESSTTPYPDALRRHLDEAIKPGARLSVHDFGTLNVAVGRVFADSARRILEHSKIDPADVVAIGSHGQTLRHSPETDPPYSVQIGDPATIASHTSITTVADFRSLDIAAGGQGAPLVPAFHNTWFRLKGENSVVVNIGGIANITVLPSTADAPIQGFDTGPGNCLLDEWILHNRGVAFDDAGTWAASGNVSEHLLAGLMAEKFIRRAPPKSTGREYFNLKFLNELLKATKTLGLNPEDIQASLLEFTASSIVHGIQQSSMTPKHVYVCGGGVENLALMNRLRTHLPNSELASTDARNIDPHAIEAMAFAWLAQQRLVEKPVTVTTARNATARILGAVYMPTK
ncbi:MAG: anhydro-N-acetylmuramic acid kinase [Gammaproteobacteria bacterium]|jgi:anhydro-N-acetylmuramic acid kinase